VIPIEAAAFSSDAFISLIRCLAPDGVTSTEEDYVAVEYGHFAEYIDWRNSTWKPTMEAMKKAGLIIDYKVFQATPKSPDQPNMNFIHHF
jgi:hypothetical protein